MTPLKPGDKGTIKLRFEVTGAWSAGSRWLRLASGQEITLAPSELAAVEITLDPVEWKVGEPCLDGGNLGRILAVDDGLAWVKFPSGNTTVRGVNLLRRPDDGAGR